MFWFLEHWHLTKVLSKFGMYVVPKWYYEADAEYDTWCESLVDKTESTLEQGHSEDDTTSGNWPIEYFQLKQGLAAELDLSDGTYFKLPRDLKLELASECLDHISRLFLFF